MTGNVTVQSVDFVDVSTTYTLGLTGTKIVDYYTKPAADTGYTATSVIIYETNLGNKVAYGVSQSVAAIQQLFDEVTQVELDDVILGIGANADGTYNTPSGTNYLDATTTVMDALDTLDTTVATVIGAAVTPVVRTNNPILALNDTNSNLEALDAAIGTDAQITPVVRTNNPIVADTTVHQKIDVLDAAIGVDVTSTYFVAAADSVNTNISTIDGDLETKNVNLGFGEFATLNIAAAAGEIDVYSRIAGTDGNSLTIQLLDSAGAAGTLTWVFPDLVVEIDDGVTTDDEVAEWVNGDATVNKYFYIVSSSTGAMDTMASGIALAGGDITSEFPVDEGSPLLDSIMFASVNRDRNLYNGVQMLGDAVDILNQRDVHTQDTEHTIKHPLMAVVVYDFAVDGTGADAFPRTIDLNLNSAGTGGRNLLPDNAVIIRGIQDVLTAPNSAASGGTIKFKLPTDGDITANITADGGTSGFVDVIPVSTAATAIKTTAARPIQVEIGTEALTAGKIKLFIEYYVSE